MGIISSVSNNTNSTSLTAAAQKTMGKDDFLQLLVAKLTHQDPMKPMDDESFVAELAQFSSLEQLQNLNESLTNSLQWDYLQNQTINNTMATSLIGRKVTASAHGTYLNDSNKPDIAFTTDEYATKVTIKITDSNGTVVRTLTQSDVAPGSNTVAWDGKDENGDRLAAGYYTVEITATNSSGESFTPSTLLQGKVTGVVYRNGLAYLQIDGAEISLGDVTAISEG